MSRFKIVYSVHFVESSRGAGQKMYLGCFLFNIREKYVPDCRHERRGAFNAANTSRIVVLRVPIPEVRKVPKDNANRTVSASTVISFQTFPYSCGHSKR